MERTEISNSTVISRDSRVGTVRSSFCRVKYIYTVGKMGTYPSYKAAKKRRRGKGGKGRYPESFREWREKKEKPNQREERKKELVVTSIKIRKRFSKSPKKNLSANFTRDSVALESFLFSSIQTLSTSCLTESRCPYSNKLTFSALRRL